MEAIQRAKEENPNAKITEVVITRTDERKHSIKVDVTVVFLHFH